MMDQEIDYTKVLQKALDGPIDYDEALYLFKETENAVKAQDLFRTALAVRNAEIGNIFRWSGGIASVLPCKLQPLCSYCPYWTKDTTQALTIDEIKIGVKYIEEQGLKEFHLSGGTDRRSDGMDIVEIVRTIAPLTSATITVNVGAAISEENIQELKQLGVKRIGASFETINRDLFQKVKAGDSFDAKVKLAEMINDAGLEFGTGMLAGLTTGLERYKDYVDFMFFIRRFRNLKSVYVSRFFPVTGTPMADHPRCSTMEGSRIIAIMRLVLRNIDIGPAAGWSYDDIPMWVMAGGGNRIGGVHVNRVPGYKNNWYLHSALEYRDRMEYRNTIATAEKLLKESGIEEVVF
jgi:biotin synthase